MTTDLVPADNMAAIEQLDPADREIAVTRMLDEARQWLAHAVEATGPATIAQFKAQMATVAEATKQLNLSKGIQLDSQEMVRRAERGLGMAIRKGQSEGTVRRQREGGGWSPDLVVQDQDQKISPRQFFPEGKQTITETYALTDDVSDEQFEEAITEAKDEGNLSRANVVRKVKKQQPPASDRPEVLRKTRRLDDNRIVQRTVDSVEHIDALLDEVDYSNLDRDSLADWVISLSASIRALRKLKTTLEKEMTRV